MKKLLALLLAVIMVVSLCACESKSRRDRDDDDTTEATGGTVAGGSLDKPLPEGDGNNEGPDFSTIPEVELPFKNVSSNVNVGANGVKVPGIAKLDLENQKMLIVLDKDGLKGSIAIDNEAIYMVGEENGQIVDTQVLSLGDLFPASIPGANSQIPEINPEDLEKALGEIEKLVPMLDGSKDFDIETVVGILQMLGMEIDVNTLLAQLNVTAEQAEKIVNSVLDLITDPAWISKYLTIEHTIANGSGTFAVKGDLAPALYDVMAAVATEIGDEVPEFSQSGIPAMPIDLSLTLQNNIPTALSFSFANSVSVSITNTLTANSIDLDISITADGQTVALAIDGAINGDTATLTADLVSGSMKVRVFDLTAQINANKIALSLAAGPIGSRLVAELDIDLANGKPAKFEAGLSMNGETYTISGDLFDYDTTSVDLTEVINAAKKNASF